MNNFNVKFEFRERDESDLETINRTLRANHMTAVRIEKFEGYLAEITAYSRSGKPRKRSFRYGPDKVELNCGSDEPFGSHGRTYRFRIDTDFVAGRRGTTIDDYAQSWRRRHPFRVMCSLIRVSFESGQAYVILHRGRF